jgi:hypothetical protein
MQLQKFRDAAIDRARDWFLAYLKSGTLRPYRDWRRDGSSYVSQIFHLGSDQSTWITLTISPRIYLYGPKGTGNSHRMLPRY